MKTRKLDESMPGIFDKVAEAVKEKENCEGYNLSNCCGATMYGDICSACKEHTDNQCADCEESNDCPNYKSMENI